MPNRLLPSGQWNQGSQPPFELKVGNVEKAVGCLRVILVGFFSLLISCCISCAGVVLLMKDGDPLVTFGLIIVVFVVVFFVIFRLSAWRFKKAYGKTATLNVDALVLNDSSGGGEVIPYNQVTSISIKKSKSQQLGYEFQLTDQSIHDLDPDLATFPATNIPVENSVLPVVLQHWDKVVLEDRGSFLVIPDASAHELRLACAFWIAVGSPLLFIPTWWGTMAEFYLRAWKLYQQSKFCKDPFLITADGISSTYGSEAPVPLSDIRLLKRDEIAIVIESRSSGVTFMAPITARNAFTAGHWIEKKLRSGEFLQEHPVEPSDAPGHEITDHEITGHETHSHEVTGHGEGLSDLKSDLFK